MTREPQHCTESVNRRAGEEELALLAGGDLAPEAAARLERHAERCPACRATLAGLRQSLAGLALLAAEDLGPERPAERTALERVRTGVLAGAARIEREGSGGPEGDPGEAEEADGRRFRWALAAVLLVALLGAAVWLRSGAAPEPFGKAPARFAEHTAPTAPRPISPISEAPARSEPADRSDPPDLPAGPEPPDRLARSTVAPEDEPIGPDPAADAIEPSRDSTPAPAATLAAERPAEPRITIRIVSDDPDIIFYWLVEPEEKRDETVSS